MSNIIYAAYTITDLGVEMMTKDEVPQEIPLPNEIISTERKEAKSNTKILSKSVVQKRKGTHILNVMKQFISDKEN